MSKTPHEILEAGFALLSHYGEKLGAEAAAALKAIDASNRARVNDLLEANSRYQQDARDAKEKAILLDADAVRRSDWNLKLTNELMEAKAELDVLREADRNRQSEQARQVEKSLHIMILPIFQQLKMDGALSSDTLGMADDVSRMMSAIEDMQNALVNASDEAGMKNVARTEDLLAIAKAAGAHISVGADAAQLAEAVLKRVEFMNKSGKDLHEKYLALVEADRERIVTKDGQARGLLHGALCDFEKFLQIDVGEGRGAYARLSDIFDRTKKDFAERHEEIMKAEGAADRAYEERAGFLAGLQALLGIKGRNPLNGALFGAQALEVQNEIRFQLRDRFTATNPPF